MEGNETIVDLVSTLQRCIGDEDPREALAVLESCVDPTMLVEFVSSENTVQCIRSFLTIDNAPILLKCADSIGRLLLRVWVVVLERDISAHCSQHEQSSELPRRRDDFQDATVEFFRILSLKVAGKPTSPDIPASQVSVTITEANALSGPLVALMETFCEPYAPLDSYIDALVGVGPALSLSERRAARQASLARSSALAPLVQQVVDVLFEDLHLLFERCRLLPSYHDNSALGLVSSFMHCVVHKVGSSRSVALAAMLIPLPRDSRPLFGLEADATKKDPRRDAMQNTHPVSAVDLWRQWLVCVTLPLVQSAPRLEDRLRALRDSLVLLQHAALRELRMASAADLVESLLSLLEGFDADAAQLAAQLGLDYASLCVLLLLALRDAPLYRGHSFDAEAAGPAPPVARWYASRALLVLLPLQAQSDADGDQAFERLFVEWALLTLLAPCFDPDSGCWRDAVPALSATPLSLQGRAYLASPFKLLLLEATSPQSLGVWTLRQQHRPDPDSGRCAELLCETLRALLLRLWTPLSQLTQTPIDTPHTLGESESGEGVEEVEEVHGLWTTGSAGWELFRRPAVSCLRPLHTQTPQTLCAVENLLALTEDALFLLALLGPALHWSGSQRLSACAACMVHDALAPALLAPHASCALLQHLHRVYTSSSSTETSALLDAASGPPALCTSSTTSFTTWEEVAQEWTARGAALTAQLLLCVEDLVFTQTSQTSQSQGVNANMHRLGALPLWLTLSMTHALPAALALHTQTSQTLGTQTQTQSVQSLGRLQRQAEALSVYVRAVWQRPLLAARESAERLQALSSSQALLGARTSSHPSGDSSEGEAEAETPARLRQRALQALGLLLAQTASLSAESGQSVWSDAVAQNLGGLCAEVQRELCRARLQQLLRGCPEVGAGLIAAAEHTTPGFAPDSDARAVSGFWTLWTRLAPSLPQPLRPVVHTAQQIAALAKDWTKNTQNTQNSQSLGIWGSFPSSTQSLGGSQSLRLCAEILAPPSQHAAGGVLEGVSAQETRQWTQTLAKQLWTQLLRADHIKHAADGSRHPLADSLCTRVAVLDAVYAATAYPDPQTNTQITQKNPDPQSQGSALVVAALAHPSLVPRRSLDLSAPSGGVFSRLSGPTDMCAVSLSLSAPRLCAQGWVRGLTLHLVNRHARCAVPELALQVTLLGDASSDTSSNTSSNTTSNTSSGVRRVSTAPCMVFLESGTAEVHLRGAEEVSPRGAGQLLRHTDILLRDPSVCCNPRMRLQVTLRFPVQQTQTLQTQEGEGVRRGGATAAQVVATQSLRSGCAWPALSPLQCLRPRGLHRLSAQRDHLLAGRRGGARFLHSLDCTSEVVPEVVQYTGSLSWELVQAQFVSLAALRLTAAIRWRVRRGSYSRVALLYRCLRHRSEMGGIWEAVAPQDALGLSPEAAAAAVAPGGSNERWEAGWALQSLWGERVSVLLTASALSADETCDDLRMEVRAENAAWLDMLNKETQVLADLVDIVSGGSMSLVVNDLDNGSDDDDDDSDLFSDASEDEGDS